MTHSERIMKASELPKIRHTENINQQFGRWLAQIIAITGATVDPQYTELYTETVGAFIRDYFGDLTPDDIAIALQMNAAGQLDKRVSNFGKPINCEMIGEILSLYKSKRNSVMAKAFELTKVERQITDEDKAETRRNHYKIMLEKLKHYQTTGKLELFGARMVLDEVLRLLNHEITDYAFDKWKQQALNTLRITCRHDDITDAMIENKACELILAGYFYKEYSKRIQSYYLEQINN